MNLRNLAFACLALLGVLVGTGAAYAQSSRDFLRVNFIDVGQGDAILIQTPASPNGDPGKSILIDGGPDRGRRNRALSYVEALGPAPGTILDYVVLTHPHEDHDTGLLDVLDFYQVGTIIDPGMPGNATYNAFVEKAQRETIDGRASTYISLRQHPDPKLDWGPDVEARILWNDRGDAPGLGSGNARTNDASVVIRMSYGGFSFLFMGDAEGKARNDPPTTTKLLEKVLLDTQGSELRATVLKAGHHGSETSSTLQFIHAVQPEVIVIESGRTSFSGTHLPDQSVLDRFASAFPAATVLRTDFQDEEQGLTASEDADGDDIVMDTDGSTLRVYQARMDPDGGREWLAVRTLER